VNHPACDRGQPDANKPVGITVSVNLEAERVVLSIGGENIGLPVEDAFLMARQITEACEHLLDARHKRGID
jgi:hypothetical protein